ncbi:MAG: DUF3426 domain-containing protein [Methylophilaceae bacterium]
MSSITTCPNCNTKFSVTPEQLAQYDGMVRCGHCLHVFDGRNETTSSDIFAETKPTKKQNKTKTPKTNKKATGTAETSTWPSIEIDDVEAPEQIIKDAEKVIEKTKGTEFEADEDEDFAISETIDYSTISHSYDDQPIPPPLQIIETPSQFAQTIPKKRTQKKPTSRWIWFLAPLFLIAAIAQTIYFMRGEISAYFPSTKPLLQQACEKIECSINLPKKIDYIVIDDSEMQEDSERQGLIRLSSLLINQASFAQAYPNLELTLTDADNKPKLRRTFKPKDYLPAKTNLESGIPAGAEIKVKLAISAKDENVTGYRLFVTY